MKIKPFWIFTLIPSILFFVGCNPNVQYNRSTISVLGTGVVLAQPDRIQMNITLSKIAPTTKIAQEEVSKMTRQALAIFKEANIEDKNISTASLSFSSAYEYNPRRILLGQKAEQRITFSIDDINNDNEKVPAIIDQLIKINGIELNQLNFSVKDNTEYFIKSRELAFQKAAEKAAQYAELSNLKIIKVLSVSEEGSPQVSSRSRVSGQNAVFEAASFADASTVLPMGELEITTKILVVFLLK
jgi:uncharacterized protein YggE